LHEFEIAVHAGGWVLVHWVEGRQEDAVAELDHGQALATEGGIVRGLPWHLKAPGGQRVISMTGGSIAHQRPRRCFDVNRTANGSPVRRPPVSWSCQACLVPARQSGQQAAIASIASSRRPSADPPWMKPAMTMKVTPNANRVSC
jgi:hypothetical protein